MAIKRMDTQLRASCENCEEGLRIYQDSDEEFLQVENLDDQLKLDLFLKSVNNFTLEQFENIFKIFNK